MSDEKQKFAAKLAQEILEAIEAQGVDPSQLGDGRIRVETIEPVDSESISRDAEMLALYAEASDLAIRVFAHVERVLSPRNSRDFRCHMIAEALAARPSLLEVLNEAPVNTMDQFLHQRMHQIAHVVELCTSLMAVSVCCGLAVDFTAIHGDNVRSYTNCEYSAILKHLLYHELAEAELDREVVLEVLRSELNACALSLARSPLDADQILTAVEELISTFPEPSVH